MNRSSSLVLFCLVFLYSCETLFEADLSPTNNSTTTLNIRLTDGPIDLEEVNIDLQGVVVKGEEGFEEIALETNTGIYDLLDFQNGIDTLIAMADIQLERIREVRLILGDNNTVVVDGEIHELKIPSGSQSGLKIKACLDLGPMTEFDLLLDFDAGASIHQTGNGKYIMRPVIKLMNAAAQCGEEEEVEEDISLDDLPDSIIDTLETSYSGYDIEVGQALLCDETEVYKIKASLDDEVVYLFFDLDGIYLQRVVPVTDEDLPEEVVIAIGAAYPSYSQVPNSVLRIERADEEIWYQLGLEADQENFTVIYKADETLVCDDIQEEEEEEEEEEENENPIDSLPQEILDYIAANYPDLTFSSSQQTFCDGTEVYILEGKNGPVRVLLYFDLEGDLVQSATSFDERDLNDDVLASIDTDYSDYRIMNNKAWKIERADGDLWYRIYIKKNNSSKKIYVIYAADGTFICEEE